MTDSRTQGERAAALWRAKLIALFVGVPGVVLAGASLSFNVLFARQLGQDSADKLALTAVALAVSMLISGLPIAIEFLDGQLRTVAASLWAGCFVFSLVSALGFSTGTREQAAAETGAAISNRSALERSVTRAEGELATLPRHRPASAVRAELRAAEAAAGVNCAKARSRAAREMCTTVFTLQSEQAAAQEAERLEGRITSQREQLAGITVHGTADAQAEALSWIAAGQFAPETWRRLMSLFLAVLVECGAAGALLITGKAVAALLAPKEEAPVPAHVEVTPDVLEPSPLAQVDPELAFSMWFQSCVSAAKGSRITPKDAFSHYESWAALNNVAGVLPYVSFGKHMAEAVGTLGGKVGRSAGRFYDGVSLAQLGAGGVPLIESDKDAAE
jgi:hypothetical protein